MCASGTPLASSSAMVASTIGGGAGMAPILCLLRSLVERGVDRLEDDIAEVDAYVCGPPPMVEATIALLERKGVPEAHIYYDKFTTTADE